MKQYKNCVSAIKEYFLLFYEIKNIVKIILHKLCKNSNFYMSQ